jgi:hypothetical protein
MNCVIHCSRNFSNLGHKTRINVIVAWWNWNVTYLHRIRVLFCEYDIIFKRGTFICSLMPNVWRMKSVDPMCSPCVGLSWKPWEWHPKHQFNYFSNIGNLVLTLSYIRCKTYGCLFYLTKMSLRCNCTHTYHQQLYQCLVSHISNCKNNNNNNNKWTCLIFKHCYFQHIGIHIP